MPAITRPVRLSVCAGLTASLLVLTACQNADDGAGEQPTAASGASERIVPTDQGEVTIPADAERIVVLNYALAGYLYDLGAPVIATIPEDADAAAGEYSEFWAEEASEQGTEFLPWSTDGFDLEAIAQAEPDLIIGGGIGFPLFQALDVYDQLGDIAPTVLVSGEYVTWQQQFSFLAEDVFEQPEVYQDAVTAYETRAKEVAGSIELPPQPVSFLSITADGTAYGLVDGIGLPAVFEDLGFEAAPVYEDGGFEPYGPGGDMFELSDEVLADHLDQPTVFITGFNGDVTSVEELSEKPVYANLPAFRDGHAYDLPYWVVRGDFDETMALLDIVEERFARD